MAHGGDQQNRLIKAAKAHIAVVIAMTPGEAASQTPSDCNEIAPLIALGVAMATLAIADESDIGKRQALREIRSELQEIARIADAERLRASDDGNAVSSSDAELRARERKSTLYALLAGVVGFLTLIGGAYKTAQLEKTPQIVTGATTLVAVSMMIVVAIFFLRDRTVLTASIAERSAVEDDIRAITRLRLVGFEPKDILLRPDTRDTQEKLTQGKTTTSAQGG